MSWLDNMISFISPETGYRREAWRKGIDELKSYDAGDYNRLNANWRAINESAEMTDRYSRDNVRARARDLERNSDMMNAVAGAYKRNIVGGGYMLQARTDDNEINKVIEKYWKIWCKKRNCDVTGQQSFNQILRMAIERKKIDGGMLIHKVYQTGGFLPFKLQCLEVDELDISQMVPKGLRNKVVGGIELTEFNKPVGYWIKQYSLDGFSLQNPTYIEAKDIIYYYTKKRPSQVREISDMSPTITRIRDANEFMNAVSVKERIEACLSVFVKQETPTAGGMGRGLGEGKSDKYSNYNGKTLTPGMIHYLNPGEEPMAINPSGQAGDATQYMKLQQRLIGAGQGISYEATTRDMSETNYSSTRQGLIEDDLTYADDKELIQELMDEVYETFIISAVLAGLINIKDFWDNKEAYMNHEWIQAPKKWIDPAKESNANKTAIQTMQKTFQQIASENGKDWQEQIDDICEVIEYGKKQGIELGGVLFGKTNEELGQNKQSSPEK